MTLRSYRVRLRPLSTTTLTKIDIHEVSRVSTKDFSSPGALCDDQSSTQTKRGMYTVSTSKQTESTIQQHPTGTFSNNAC